MAKTKLRPDPKVFLQAAEQVRRSLNNDCGITCCDVLQRITASNNYEELHQTDEFKFFRKMFGQKRGRFNYWFGRPADDYGVPSVKNQEKRIRALNKAFAAATAIYKKEAKNARKRKKS